MAELSELDEFQKNLQKLINERNNFVPNYNMPRTKLEDPNRFEQDLNRLNDKGIAQTYMVVKEHGQPYINNTLMVVAEHGRPYKEKGILDSCSNVIDSLMPKYTPSFDRCPDITGRHCLQPGCNSIGCLMARFKK